MKKVTIVLSIAAILIMGYVGTAKANRSYFVPTIQTSDSTTTLDYLRSANEVLTLDAYASSPTAINSATLLIQSVASSTASVQTITIEYSQDGIDWYGNTLSTTTTANPWNISSPMKLTIVGNAVSSTTKTAVLVQTPVRYVRATVATSTALSAVWLQWVPVREVTN